MASHRSGGFFCLFKEVLMPKVTKDGSDTPIEVRIKQVKNGFRVCGYVDGEPTEYEYVHTKLKKALKEIEGIFSVLKEEQPEMTEEDLDKMEEKINRKEY